MECNEDCPNGPYANQRRVRPILFNTEMVRAILDGRKTVTRRVIKPHNSRKAKDNEYYQGNGLWIDPSTDNGDHEGHIKDYSISPCWISRSYYIQKYAPYRPGDILYVRETWCEFPRRAYHYRADEGTQNDKTFYEAVTDAKWRPSIHMPKAAARIWFKVTDVRIERLQEITEEQVLKEGLLSEPLLEGGEALPALWDFPKLWNSAIKKNDLALYGWDADPWVWVIAFEQCEKPEGWPNSLSL